MADLTTHELAQRRAEVDRFDEFNDEHITAICPVEFQQPIQDLLALRYAMEVAEKSGAMKEILGKRELDNLYRACVARWRDL